jgi:hypothetical protein
VSALGSSSIISEGSSVDSFEKGKSHSTFPTLSVLI